MSNWTAFAALVPYILFFILIISPVVIIVQILSHL